MTMMMKSILLMMKRVRVIKMIVKKCFLWNPNLMILPIKNNKKNQENQAIAQQVDLKKSNSLQKICCN
jgi:hypothetical protein